jgi:hypothetical protein
MSSRVAEKEQRRAERADREHQRDVEERRARRLKIIAAGAVVLVLVGAIAATALFSGGSGPQAGGRTVAGAEKAFGQHYAGLEQRRRQAGVPTMMDTMNSPIHFHPTVAVFVYGRQVPVPPNIGIDPRRDPMQMAGLHTHDSTGTIHVEGAPAATLGKFFRIWGVPLSAKQLGPYRTGGSKAVRMWVDGKPSGAFGELKLKDGQRIVISYGSDRRRPGG